MKVRGGGGDGQYAMAMGGVGVERGIPLFGSSKDVSVFMESLQPPLLFHVVRHLPLRTRKVRKCAVISGS